MHIGDEIKTDNHTVADDLVDQEEIGGDECAIDEEIGIDCSTEVGMRCQKILKSVCGNISIRSIRQLIEYWKHPTVQVVFQIHQNSRETTDNAFMAVFGKEQPGRLRCYGRSVTTSSLKKDEETNELK
ncbi:hypothetical protein KY289_026730 [Solanum tuberosum]|nr:hypothetical protein KY289_026730 [Solanum tuberosum]